MQKHVVAISIDKVQAFLYHMLQAEIQEHQLDSGSLSDVVQSSRLISEQLYQDIGVIGDNGIFSGSIVEELLVCSGLCIFTTDLEREKIQEELDKLFKSIYKQYSGQLLMRYVYFEAEIASETDKLTAIHSSKRRLKGQDCLNQIISRNQDLLFQFNDTDSKTLRDKLNENEQPYTAFSETINALYSEEEADNSNHFRIAVIKADLDGMGDLFEGIKNYKAYQAISEVLTKYINLNHLHEKTKGFQEKDPGFKLYPLYMAGDDIFFAVSMSRLLDGVNICRSILREMNDEIRQISELYRIPIRRLSMSIGVDFTFNREPIRYYHERVQHQLDLAKQALPLSKEKTEIETSGIIKVCINDYVFYDCDKKLTEANNLPNWRFFMNDVKNLMAAMEEGFAAHHFLYGLLNKLEDRTVNSNDIKYSNAVLYHLLPKYLTSSNKKLRELELLIIKSILDQLVVSRKEHDIEEKCSSTQVDKKNQKIENELSLAEDRKLQLKKFIRLLLIFSDPRFKITRDDKKFKINFGIHRSRVSKTLFDITKEYMYEQSLGRSLNQVDAGSLREIFIRPECYEAPNGYNLLVYRTLQISSSMFYRFKQLDNGQIEVVASMIRSVNNSTEEEITKREEERKQQKKAPPGLYFEEETFIDIVRRTNIWSDDYIDALYIFYRYNNLSIQFKTIFPKKKPRRKKSNKSSGGKRK